MDYLFEVKCTDRIVGWSSNHDQFLHNMLHCLSHCR